MIVPMKKVALLAMASEENSALTALRKLGVMQIESKNGVESGKSQELAESHNAARRILLMLQKYCNMCESCGEAVDKRAKPRSGAEVIAQATQLFDSREKLVAELNSVQQRLKQLAIWGDFDRAKIEELKQNGVFVYLCCGRDLALREAETLKDAETQLIAKENGRNYFVVLSTEPIDEGILPEIHLSKEDNPPLLRDRKSELQNELQAVKAEIDELLISIPAVAKRVDLLNSELEFSRAGDALSLHGEIVALFGFVPAPAISELEKAADKNGWGLMIEDPEPGDRVPTLIKTSNWVKTIAPLFQFLGIEPGYDEIDVSAGVLIFFTIFYAMIVGDAGYGAIFLAGTLWAAWKFRGNPAAVLPVRLFALLSVATIVWGVLTSNIFGTANPQWLKWAEVPQLTDESSKNAYTQLICFSLALLQLSLGRIWKALHDGTIRGIFGNLGWVFFLVGNFILTVKLLVFPGDFPVMMYWIYGIGLVLVAFADVNWKDVAQVFQFPFSIINSFVDVLSYIRLFAVGLAGYYIASSFNGMGESVFKLGSAWLTVIPAAIVILFGHALNIALCIMSVMVHGVRLNTLEFSNHVGLTWSGLKFKPFCNRKKMEGN
ncbi:MAG: hypothetical protein LBM70_03240 [Victivallales bacterium]|jgi:V/A-type H+-transporting ATPase subunit I|nr:hypothetical protein [Victivallales bacterium]